MNFKFIINKFSLKYLKKFYNKITNQIIFIDHFIIFIISFYSLIDFVIK